MSERPASNSSSKSSATSSTSKRKREDVVPLDRLAGKIESRLFVQTGGTLSCNDHRRGVDCMTVLRDALIEVTQPCPPSVAMTLTRCGIKLQRFVAHEVNSERTDVFEMLSQLKITIGMLFALVVLCAVVNDEGSAQRCGQCDLDGEAADDDDAHDMGGYLQEWQLASFESDLSLADGRSPAASSWAASGRSPSVVANACLVSARRTLQDLSMEDLSMTGLVFFRASAKALALSIFDKALSRSVDACCQGTTSGAPVASLEAASTLAGIGLDDEKLRQRLLDIVDVAESDAGQQIFRDLILSFRLPRTVVGVRRTCLLTRDTNALASREHTDTMSHAHAAAMRGARWCFEHDEEPEVRRCAVLAGVAVIMLDTHDSLRKDDMYAGRIDLPFIETMPPPANVNRLMLLEHSHEWVVYSVTAKGEPKVKLRESGQSGFFKAIVVLVADR